MRKFSAETEQVLRAAGWEPDRAVDVDPWCAALTAHGFRVHDAARRFLVEFGGLKVDVHGSGISCARVPFELDPTLCCGEEDRFLEWGEVLGRSFCPLGELDDGRYFLAIDQGGEIYLMVDWVARFGKACEALEKLIQGVAPEDVSVPG